MPVNTSFFSRLTIEGGGLEKLNNIGTERLMLSCSMSLTVDQASEISIELNDPGWAWAKSFSNPKAKPGEDRGPIGKKGMYGTDMPLAVTAFSLGPGPAGQGGTTIKLTPGGIFRSKNIRGALTRTDLTPTDYARGAAISAGMKFVGEPSPKRPSIARDVGDPKDKSTDASDWSTVQRLAGEEGFLAFECLNTLYFATPKWLFDKMPTFTVGMDNLVTDDSFRLMRLPSIDISSVNKEEDEISFQLPLEAAGKILPGNTVTVKGVPGIGNEKLLVTSVDFPLAGLGDLTLKAKRPWKVEKQTSQAPGGGGGGSRPAGSFSGASGSYGMPPGTNINYGGGGFPGWVYNVAKAHGVKASTYAGHQESNRNEAGYAPNPRGLNRGIDWSGSVSAMQRFAEYVRRIAPNTPAIEQIIWMNPGTGQRIGWYGRSPDSNGSYFASDYGGHQDHVHTRQNAGWG